MSSGPCPLCIYQSGLTLLSARLRAGYPWLTSGQLAGPRGERVSGRKVPEKILNIVS